MSLREFFSGRKGFTLVEIIIVVGITAILAGVILTYTSNSRNQVALFVEQAKLAQTVSRTKSLAITTYTKTNPPCGYILQIDYDAQSYSVYPYTVAAGTPCGVKTMADIQKGDAVSTDKMPINVRLDPSGEEAIDTVLFLPPDPQTWIWKLGFLATSTQGQIHLTTQGGAVSIGVSRAGQITF